MIEPSTPPPKRAPIAFLIHPRKEVSADLAKLFGAPFGWLPDRAYDWALSTLPVPPLVTGKLRYSDEPSSVAGWMVTVPLGAQQLLSLPRRQVQDKVAQAVDKARDLGARVVGLGALTAPVTLGGKTLAKRTDIGVTNGNAFTAAMTLLGIEQLLRRFPADPVIAIVGATGSVGTCLTHLLAKRGLGQLLLVARNEGRLARLAGSLGTPFAARISTEMSDVRSADLIVLLTSAAETILRSEHLKPGAVVLDDTQPRNTDPHLLTERPDVLVVDGGLVEVPGMDLKGSVGLPRGLVYACLAETMLLGLSGQTDHFSIGEPSVEQAERMLELSRRHASLGFRLAPFRSFGRLIDAVPGGSEIQLELQPV